MEAYIEMPN